MGKAKKINPNAQAPELIRKIQATLKWSQTQLEAFLGMSQQAVSNYLAGTVQREQYGVIKKLEQILATKLPPPTAEEVINSEERNGAPTRSDESARSTGAKTTGSRAIQTRRTAGNFRRGK